MGRKITSVVIWFIMLITPFLVSYANNYSLPLIGTCYNYNYNVQEKIDQEFVDSTGIRSFRFSIFWNYIDYLLQNPPYDYSIILDTLNSYVPKSVSPIFVINFWNPGKMDDSSEIPFGGAHETYKVADQYRNDFAEMCFNVAKVLKGRVKYFVLHNEPNIGWSDSTTGPNWRSSPDDYVDQCMLAASNIKAANPDAYIIYGAFAGINTSAPFVDSVINLAVPPGNQNDLIDALDFHIYGTIQSISSMEFIADGGVAFCSARNVDLSILETSGPEIVFPADSICPADTEKTIRDKLIEMRINALSLDEIVDSLYNWTRYYEPENLALPENEVSLEFHKVDEFNKRVVPLVENGASIVHWFASFVKPRIPVPLTIQSQSITPQSDISPDDWVDDLLKKAWTNQVNLCRLYDEGPRRRYTPLARRMREFTNKLYGDDSGSDYEDDDSGNQIDTEPKLFPNYPNGFNSVTKIGYYLPEKANVVLDIFNLQGERIETLINADQVEGYHSVSWDARSYSSGIYFYRLNANGQKLVRRMLFIK